MKARVLILCMMAAAAVAVAQTHPKAATTKAAPSATKLPPGVPAAGIPAVRTLKKTAFSLQYQEIKVGTGEAAEPNKMYHVLYTGWRAKDGAKFDASTDHPGPPELGPDGKPVLGPDGKPKMGPPQPLAFPQGMGRLIPGFDQGVAGMRVGGKRRLFVPWQLGYGTREIPDRGPGHPGIPAKSDLIFDVELVEVTDLPAAPMRPGMGGMPPGRPMPPRPVPGAPPAAGVTPGTARPDAPAAKPAAAPAAQATPPPASETKPQ